MYLVSSTKFFVTNSSSDVYALDLSVPQFDFQKLVQANRVILALAQDKNLLKEALKAVFEMLLKEEILGIAEEIIEWSEYEELRELTRLDILPLTITSIESIRSDLITLGLYLQTNYPQDGDGYLHLEGVLYDLIVESVVQYFGIPTRSRAGYAGTRFGKLPLEFVSGIFDRALKKYSKHKLFAFIHEDSSYGELVRPKNDKETLLQILTRRPKLKANFEQFKDLTIETLEYQDARIGFYVDKDNLLWLLVDINCDFDIRLQVLNDEFKFVSTLLKVSAI